MNASDAANADQIAYWNAAMGPTWVAMQDALDRQLRELGLEAMTALRPQPGERLIDIGCGCGDTALELARRVGETGAVLGVDVSAPMLALARRRAAEAGLAQARFLEADAQTETLPAADGAFSRFGVMFFADPVAAFANVGRALAGGGRLAFVCWRALADNPWMAVPGAAAGAVADAPPAPPAPDAPGPFALAERAKIERILAAAGFGEVEVTAHDRQIGWGDLESAVDLALRLGPAAGLARENPPLQAAIAEAVRQALAPHAGAEGVRLDAAAWIVRARAP